MSKCLFKSSYTELSTFEKCSRDNEICEECSNWRNGSIFSDNKTSFYCNPVIVCIILSNIYGFCPKLRSLTDWQSYLHKNQ
jgi:hypothetical protein